MKLHLNSLDPDFYLDLHLIAHFHEYQFPKPLIHPSIVPTGQYEDREQASCVTTELCHKCKCGHLGATGSENIVMGFLGLFLLVLSDTGINWRLNEGNTSEFIIVQTRKYRNKARGRKHFSTVWYLSITSKALLSHRYYIISFWNVSAFLISWQTAGGRNP